MTLVQVKRFIGSVCLLKEIIDSWIAGCNAESMGIRLDEEVYLNDLQRLVNDSDSDLLVLEKDSKIIGFMGLMIFDSPLGRQKIANEHYFYIMPEYRGISGVRMIKAAEDWAKDKGCSHLVMNASYLASDMCDKVCKLYERLGLRHFEHAYIKLI